MEQNSDLIDMTAEIVSAYVANNNVKRDDLAELINEVHSALKNTVSASEIERSDPAVPIEESVTNDYIVCLEDGQKFKSLKRHLSSHYDMSPDEYRLRWGLPKDYPMVAPSYAKKRSSLAKKMGLGQKRVVKKTVMKRRKK